MIVTHTLMNFTSMDLTQITQDPFLKNQQAVLVNYILSISSIFSSKNTNINR
jgi:hypothetical protein